MPVSSSSSLSRSSPSRCNRSCSATASDDSDDHVLLCAEDAGSFSDGEAGNDSQQVRECCPDLPSCLKFAGVDNDDEYYGEQEDEEVVATWVGVEGNYSPAMGYRARFLALPGSLDPDARCLAAAWILKVREFYGFQPPTAYLAVNYMDRFLSRHSLPQPAGGWPMQLLSVACLSLAAKMEETLVPSLLDLQVEGARFVFEPRTVQRMELLVLDAIEWRLRSVTPFTFLGFFACRADPSGEFATCMVSRATHIILDTIQEVEFLDHCQSAMAVAAMICAASEVPSLPLIAPESAASWCAGLTTDGIVNCHLLMHELITGAGSCKQQRRRRRPRVPPQSKSAIPSVGVGPGLLSSSSSTSSNKRRKLSSYQWVGDGHGRHMSKGGGIN